MTEQVIIEVCVDSVASAMAAERGGAQRVELCSDLLEGGVTPSLGLIEAVRSNTSIGVHPIIRPRPGDFFYSDEEFDIMRRDIDVFKDAGVDGVVLGILNVDATVDVERTRELVECARPLSVTYHRAFDMSANLLRALDDVCATGAERILTSGGGPDCVQGMKALAELVKAARDRVTIMAGGGIGHNNAAKIIERTTVKEIHVGLASPKASPMLHRNSRVFLGKTQGTEYQRTEVLENDVRALVNAVTSVNTKPR